MDVHAHLATRVRTMRDAARLSLDALAERSGVSRSNISLIERGESSPTAVVLDKLATALGVTLASLFAEPAAAAVEPSPVARVAGQPRWTDPASGYGQVAGPEVQAALARKTVAPVADVDELRVESPAGASHVVSSDHFPTFDVVITHPRGECTGHLWLRDRDATHVLRQNAEIFELGEHRGLSAALGRGFVEAGAANQEVASAGRLTSHLLADLRVQRLVE